MSGGLWVSAGSVARSMAFQLHLEMCIVISWASGHNRTVRPQWGYLTERTEVHTQQKQAAALVPYVSSRALLGSGLCTFSCFWKPKCEAPDVPPDLTPVQIEEELGEGWRWSHKVKRVLHTGESQYQQVELMDTNQWGKVSETPGLRCPGTQQLSLTRPSCLHPDTSQTCPQRTHLRAQVLLLDGRMQSSEADELLYHELMVHPALLHHSNPKTVLIMGGMCLAL